MSSPGRDRSEEGDRDADHLILQFLIVIQKRHIKNISRREGALVGRDYCVVEENERTQETIMKLR
jgi:hypothetical protein